MNASRNGLLKRKFLASALVIAAAGIALFLALPGDLKQTALKTSLVYAGGLDGAVTTAPVWLSDGIVLESGAEINVRALPDSANAPERTGQDQDQAVDLRKAVITVTQSPASQNPVADGPPRASGQQNVVPLVATIRALGFRELHLRNATIQLKRPGGALRRVGRFNGQLNVTSEKARKITVRGTLARQNELLQINAVVSGGTKNANEKILEVDVTGENLKLALNGKLVMKGGVRVTSEEAHVETNNLRRFLSWLGMGTETSVGFSKFTADGHLQWNGSTVAFDESQFMIDGNQANGRLSFYFDPREPSIEGTLAFQTLELSPYLGSSDQPTATGALTRAWTAIHNSVSDGMLPLGFKEVDADLRLSANSLQFGGLEIGSGAAVLLIKDGKLKADIADMTLANGAKGRSQFEIDATGFVPGYVLRGNINDVDLGNTSTLWLGKPIVDGEANMTFDLAAQGRNKDDLLKTLSGPIVVSAEKGASIPIDLVELFTKTKQSPNDGWNNIESGFTALTDLSVELMSSQGSLKTQSVKASIDGNALIATGTLKLTDLVLDLILTKLAASRDPAGEPKVPVDPPAVTETKKDVLEFKGPITEPVIRSLPASRKG